MELPCHDCYVGLAKMKSGVCSVLGGLNVCFLPSSLWSGLSWVELSKWKREAVKY